MPSVKIVLDIEAENDINEILDYLYTESGSEKVVNDFTYEMERHFELLKKFPEMGSPREDLFAGCRKQNFYSRYNIYYVYENKKLMVLRILHSSRDITPSYF